MIGYLGRFFSGNVVPALVLVCGLLLFGLSIPYGYAAADEVVLSDEPLQEETGTIGGISEGGLDSGSFSEASATAGDGETSSISTLGAHGATNNPQGSSIHLSDLFTGSMSFSIPIEVPPGRNGMQPDLSLVYRSNNGNGWLGVGWELEVGTIERNSKNGVNYSGDDFVYRVSGAAVDLINIGGNEYRTKIESGGFVRFRKISGDDGNEAWEATDKAGRKSYFGRDTASRQYKNDNIEMIFKWCIDWVEDVNGNYMTFAYVSDEQNNQLYLSEIEYSGNNSLLPENIINFYTEVRNDSPDIYALNYKVKTTRRLRSIVVSHGTSIFCCYELTYGESINTKRSILKTFQRFAGTATIDTDTGEVSGGDSLPAQTFTYTPGNQRMTGPVYGPGFFVSDSYKYAVPVDLARVRTGDFNGDGKADLAQIGGWGNYAPVGIYLSTGGAFANPYNGPNFFISADEVYGPIDVARIQTGDFDGNGKTDFMQIRGFNSTEPVHIHLAGDSGFYAPFEGPSFSVSGLSGGWWGPSSSIRDIDIPRIKLGDFNGDGKTDIFEVRGYGDTYPDPAAYEPSKIYFSAGDSFQSSVNGPTFQFVSVGRVDVRSIFLGDFNGDGKTDIAHIRGYNSALPSKIYLSTGSGFAAPLDGPALFVSSSLKYAVPVDLARIRIADFNGDGKADIAQIAGWGGSAPMQIYLSTGNGFSDPINGPIFSVSAHEVYAPRELAKIGIGDYNGDGKADISAIPNSGNMSIFLSTGAGFFSAIAGAPIAIWCGTDASSVDVSRQRFGDFNGDGKTDIVKINGWGGFAPIGTYYSEGPDSKVNRMVPDLLKTVANGLGAKTTIEYISSSSHSPPHPQLPFPVQTVSSITTDDGNGVLGTTLYDFDGGYYHIGKRDFRGFHYAKVTGPAGPNGERSVTENWFHQGDDTTIDTNNPDDPDGYMKGKPYRTLVTDGQGNVHSEVTTTYTEDDDDVAPYFNPPAEIVSIIKDGNASSLTKKVTYEEYDQYGNIKREVNHGDVNAPGDEFTVVREYAENVSAWIVGLPASEAVYEGTNTDGDIKSQTEYFYDGPTDCSSPTTNTVPTTGRLTTIKSWLKYETEPEAWLETLMGYDPYGNPTCQRDPKGNISRIYYDSSNTFPARKVNPLLHEELTEYYGVEGVAADKGLFGQVKSVTDPNGAAVTVEYDVFGRKKKETLSDGSWSTWAYNNLGVVGSQHVRTDNSLGLWSESYFDGLGRTFYARKPGSEDRVVAVDTSYDVRGAVAHSSIPYFEVEGTTVYSNLFTYDAMGRTIRVDHPDDTFELSCHDDAVSVRIDANGHRKRETRDAFGRLSQVEEYTGTFATCDTAVGTPYATTTYEYDVLGNLRFVTDAKNNRTEMRYDSLGRKRFMHDPDMGDWGYLYDANGNLTSQTDAKGQTITFQYDALNRPTLKDYPAGTDVVFAYDEVANGYALGRLTTMTDASGTTKSYYDDPLGRTTRTVRTVDGQSYSITAVVDALGRTESITYPDGERIDYAYHPDGSLWKVADAAVTYAEYSGFNALGQPGRLTNGNGIVTDYTYYANNNRLWTITTENPANPSPKLLNLTYDYDDTGNVSEIFNFVNPARNQVFVYDDLDRLLNAQSSDYGELAYAYDQIGNLLIKGGSPDFQYDDSNGNGMWDPGSEQVLSSESADNLILFGQATDIPLSGDWDGDGIATPGVKHGNTYHLRNSNSSGVADIVFTYGDPSDTPIVGDWDGDGTDTIGVKRGNNYFLRNSNTAGVADVDFIYGDPSDTPVVGDWDGDGIDTIGVKRGDTYYLRNSNSAGVADLTFSFGLATDLPVSGAWLAGGPDKIGVFRQGSWYFDKNGNGRWESPLSFDSFDSSIAQYGLTGDAPLAGDWNGNGLVGVAVFRNGEWRLDADSNGVGSAGDFFYPSFGLPGDLAVAGDWDGDGAAEIGVFRNGEWRLDVNNDGLMLAGDIFCPAYGLAGDKAIAGDWDGDGVTEIGVFRNGEWRLDVDNNGVGSPGDIFYPAFGISSDTPVAGDWNGDGVDEIGVYRAGTWYLDFNGNGQWDGVYGGDVQMNFGNSDLVPVTGDWDGDGVTEIGTFGGGAWQFDLNHNGVWDPPGQESVNPVAYTPHPTKPHALAASSDGRTYSYDGNGNMVYDGFRQFIWNYDNRPTSITYGGATTTFVYDGAGNRVKKVGPAGTIVYIDKLYELSGGVPAKYIFANGQRIALKSASGTLYYHQDHLGSTGVVTDQSGSKVEDIFYKPFGESASDTGTISLNHKYTGQELDDETGLYFYNARYYNPNLGRFVSADTFVPDPSNPQAFNRFSYVLNNPLYYTDPSGHAFDPISWIAAVIFVAVGTYLDAQDDGAGSGDGISAGYSSDGGFYVSNYSPDDRGTGMGSSGYSSSYSSGSDGYSMNFTLYASDYGRGSDYYGGSATGYASSEPPSLSSRPRNGGSSRYLPPAHPSMLQGGASFQGDSYPRTYGYAPSSPSSCHLGDRSGLYYPEPNIPFHAGVSATGLAKTASFAFLPKYDYSDSSFTSVLVPGASLDLTFGDVGKMEVSFPFRHAGVGLNLDNGLNVVGYSVHFGLVSPKISMKSLVNFSIDSEN